MCRGCPGIYSSTPSGLTVPRTKAATVITAIIANIGHVSLTKPLYAYGSASQVEVYGGSTPLNWQPCKKSKLREAVTIKAVNVSIENKIPSTCLTKSTLYFLFLSFLA